MQKENIIGVHTPRASQILPLDEQNLIILNPSYIGDTLNKISNLKLGPVDYYEGFINGYLVYRKATEDGSYVWGYLSKTGKNNDVSRIIKLGIPTLGQAPFMMPTEQFSRQKISGFFNVDQDCCTTFGCGKIVDLEPFHDGLAPIKLEKKYFFSEDKFYYWVYINMQGQIVSDEFDMASRFMNGKALVRKDGHKYFIDTNMRYIRDFNQYTDNNYLADIIGTNWDERLKDYTYKADDITIQYQNGYIRATDNKTNIPILFIPILNKIIEEFELSRKKRGKQDFNSLWKKYTHSIAENGDYGVFLDDSEIVPVKLYKGERLHDTYGGSVISFQDKPIQRVRKKAEVNE